MTNPANTPDQTVRTRFAPSPTGELHIGGARTALFNWAYARRFGGKFILRIEDTDQKRSSTQSMKNILRDLQWLNIHSDEGPRLTDGQNVEVVGDAGPYFQSQRLDLYRDAITKLKADGHAVDEDGAVRFKASDQDVTVQDAVLGAVTYPAAELEDFIIQKADGFPTFHLANVIDDAGMNITHVIRGQEHLINTSKHLQLFEALGLTPPTFAHIPLIFNPDGSKMSKRDKAKVSRTAAESQNLNEAQGIEADRFAAFLSKDNNDLDIAVAVAEQLGVTLPEIDVEDFKQSGYLPSTLCNYLALLGWNPGNDLERFDNGYLCKHFGFERVGKSNSKFDREKLSSFSQDDLKVLPASDLVNELQTAAPDNFKQALTDDTWPAFAEAYRERSKTLLDPFEQGAFFVAACESITPDFENKGVKKAVLKGDPNGIACLKDFLHVLENITDWSGQAVHEAIENYCNAQGVNMGKIAQPIRVALSGTPVTPPLDLTIDILGREKTMARINRFLETAPTE